MDLLVKNKTNKYINTKVLKYRSIDKWNLKICLDITSMNIEQEDQVHTLTCIMIIIDLFLTMLFTLFTLSNIHNKTNGYYIWKISLTII